MNEKIEKVVAPTVKPPPSLDEVVDVWVSEVLASFKDRGLDHEFFANFRQQADSLKARISGRKE